MALATLSGDCEEMGFFRRLLGRLEPEDSLRGLLSKNALEQLDADADVPVLSGETRKATMFFSSIDGFMSISEKLPPQRLFELVNRCLAPMTDIIIDGQGYIDKYEGDGIMAVWGVPRSLQNHASLACLSALECQEKMSAIRPELKTEFGVDVRIRMGLNSGRVCAGNMGSNLRFSYTPMGEAVNQAARFEPANKDYGTSIMIGETTYEAAREAIEARLLDILVVKGKDRPIRAYELVSRKGQLSSDTQAVLDLFADGHARHCECDWDGALQCFENALQIRPDDGPSKAMVHRVRSYKEMPQNIFAAGGAWDGAFKGIFVRRAAD